MILLVASNKDTASLNIKEQILKNYVFQKTDKVFQENPIYTANVNQKQVNLITIEEDAVKAQMLPENFPEAQLIIFISKHSSQSGKPTLSVHTPGNFAAAELGGLPKAVSVAPAFAMQTALQSLLYHKEHSGLDYEVSYECTHHGPSLNVPTMFVELGSLPQQWVDSRAAKAVADSAMAAIYRFSCSTSNSAVLGIGGTHYNQQFTIMSIVGAAAFGHIIPKYAIPMADSDMIKQCVEKTFERVHLAILDWKGIKSEDKPSLISALEAIGLPYKKV